MTRIEGANNQQISCQSAISKENILIASLAALVMAAGAACMGFALVGDLPHWCLYLGTAVIAVDIAILGVVATVHYLQKMSAKDSVDREKDVESEAPYMEPASVNDLPNEMLPHIFQYLDGEDLRRAMCVSKQWNHLIQHPSLLSKILLDEDWREEKPDCKKAIHCLNALKSVKKPRSFDAWVGLCHGQGVCSGNHLVLSDYCGTVSVWRLDSHSGQLVERCTRKFPDKPLITSIGYYGEVVYLGLSNGNVGIWNLVTNEETFWQKVHEDAVEHISVSDKTIVTKQLFLNSAKVWAKETLKIMHTFELGCNGELINLDKVYLYKDKTLIFKKSDGIWIGDFDYLRKEKILKTEHKDQTLAEVKLVNGVLFVQRVDKRLFGKDTSILRYDLEENEWLPELKTSETFDAAIGGLVITSNSKGRSKIWDFR